jgi:hypothetical protein
MGRPTKQKLQFTTGFVERCPYVKAYYPAISSHDDASLGQVYDPQSVPDIGGSIAGD